MKALQLLKRIVFFAIFLASTNSFAQNWNLHFSDSIVLNEVIFPDQNTGYIFRDDGVVFKSIDQGQSWNLLSLGAGSSELRLKSAFFFDANNGYAAGRHNNLNAVVVKTTDGGNTWTSSTNFSERLQAIAFSNTMNGIVAGRNGYWCKTTNAGTTWVTQSSFTSEDINDVYFINSTTAILICDGGELYRSSNGGLTWTLIITNTTEDLSSIHFVNASNGFVTATGGTMLKTQDGGSTWTVLTTGVNFDLEDAHFINSTNGYAVGLSTEVVHTTDGGNTWNVTSTSCLSDIMSIVMLSNNLGYFVTHDGEVFIRSVTTEIDELSDSKLKAIVAPNPVRNQAILTIVDEQHSMWNIALYDILGNRLKMYNNINQSKIKLNGSDLNAGIYFYKIINSDNKSYTGSFTVN